MPPLCSCRQARENRKSPSLRALLVVAHPLDNAFAKAAAARIRATLEHRGIEVDMIDLYADEFDPRLTSAERRDVIERRTHEICISNIFKGPRLACVTRS